jgi:hypothetical protein
LGRRYIKEVDEKALKVDKTLELNKQATVKGYSQTSVGCRVKPRERGVKPHPGVDVFMKAFERSIQLRSKKRFKRRNE